MLLTQFKSIRKKLFFTNALVYITFALVVVVVSFSFLLNSFADISNEQYSNSLSTYSQLVGEWLIQNTKAIEIYSNTDKIKSMDFDEINDYLLREIEGGHTFFDLFITASTDGDYVLSNSDFTGNIAQRQYFQEALKGNVSISNLLMAQESGEEALVIVSPIYKDDEIVGVLGGALFKKSIFNFVKNYNPLKGDLEIYLLDETGQVISSLSDTYLNNDDFTDSNPETAIILKDIAQSVKDADTETPTQLATGKDIYFYKTIPQHTQWTLAIKLTKSVYSRPIDQARIVILIIIVIFLIASLLYSNFYAEKISKPIISLKNTFEDAASGNLHIKAQIHSNDEIGTAAKSFNMMMQKVRVMTYQDPLTKLANYRYFVENLNTLINSIDSADIHDTEIAVVTIGIDSFRTYNNAYGISSGDNLLKQLATVLIDSIGSKQYICRIAGDEFSFIITGKNVSKKALSLIHYINGQLKKGLEINGNKVYLTVSSGVALYPKDGSDTESLISNAGTAMTVSKSQSKGGFQFYQEELGKQSSKYMAISNDIKRAIDNNEFYLVYQPIKELQSDQFSSMETLIRWEHKDFGYLSPELFIQLAEENGMIIELGHWILNQAVSDFSKVIQKLDYEMKLAINISPLQLKDPNFLKILFNVITKYDVDPQLIVLEITERVLLHCTGDTQDILRRIKEFGCNISLDDFGTGYSSLNYLYKYPFDIMKIDKSFIADMLENKTKRKLVRGIIRIASSMDFKTVAEGVETLEQVDFLSKHGCNKLQGYYYTRPLAFDALYEFLGLHGSPEDNPDDSENPENEVVIAKEQSS